MIGFRIGETVSCIDHDGQFKIVGINRYDSICLTDRSCVTINKQICLDFGTCLRLIGKTFWLLSNDKLRRINPADPQANEEL